MVPLGKVRSISCGIGYAMALDTAGVAWTWKLGRTPSPVRAQVPFQAVSCGGGHFVALDVQGGVWSWGADDVKTVWDDSDRVYAGRLGHGRLGGRHGPRMLTLSTSPGVFVVASRTYSQAVLADGSVWLWGYVGESGGGPRIMATPVRIPGLAKIRKVTTKTHNAMNDYRNIALDVKGQRWSWSWSLEADLQFETQELSSSPVLDCAIGDDLTLALARDGSVTCSSYYNPSGQRGTGEVGEGKAPMTEHRLKLPPVAAISCGRAHALALDKEGTVWSWGANGSGQLGRPTPGEAGPTPQPVVGLRDVAAISANGDASLVLTKAGVVWVLGVQTKTGGGSRALNRNAD